MDIGVNVTQPRQQHGCELVPSLKQLSLFSSLLALLVDLLSFAGLLPFTGGYSFTIVRFASAPQLVDTIRGRLSSGVLFVLMNAIIVAILATSGCFKDQQDTDGSHATADLVPAPVPLEEEQEQHEETSLAEEQEQHEVNQSDEPPQRSSSEDEDHHHEQQQQHSKKASKKVKRQLSSPAALGTTPPSPKTRTKTIVVEKPRPAKSASFPAPAAAAVKGLSASDSFNLVTCEQEVFNQIVESYIDKFRQDMRQQEMQSVVNGQLFASRAPNW